MILIWLRYYQKQKTLWVRQFTSPKYGNLKKNIKFTVRQFASTCLSVKTLQTTQITLNEHQNQPFQLQTTSCPQTHHTKHFSTRYGPAHDTFVLIAYSQKFYLIEQQRPWRDCADAQASLSVWLLVVPNLMYMRKGVNWDYWLANYGHKI